jgi:hypothetical protein
VWKRWILSVNVAKRKVMRVTRKEDVGDFDIILNGRRMEEVDSFSYLRLDFDRDGRIV